MNSIIEALSSINDPKINAIIRFALSSETTIHVYCMPAQQAASSKTQSLMSGSSETLESRFYERAQYGLTLQTPYMAANGQADVIFESDLASTSSYMFLVVLLDELNHVLSEGIDCESADHDHLSLFSHLLMLSDRGVINLPKVIYNDLRERVNHAGKSTEEPQNNDSAPTLEQPKE